MDCNGADVHFQVDAIVTGVNYEGFLAMAGPLQLFVSREVGTSTILVSSTLTMDSLSRKI